MLRLDYDEEEEDEEEEEEEVGTTIGGGVLRVRGGRVEAGVVAALFRGNYASMRPFVHGCRFVRGEFFL